MGTGTFRGMKKILQVQMFRGTVEFSFTGNKRSTEYRIIIIHNHNLSILQLDGEAISEWMHDPRSIDKSQNHSSVVHPQLEVIISE